MNASENERLPRKQAPDLICPGDEMGNGMVTIRSGLVKIN